jgi:hypothetical protein
MRSLGWLRDGSFSVQLLQASSHRDRGFSAVLCSSEQMFPCLSLSHLKQITGLTHKPTSDKVTTQGVMSKLEVIIKNHLSTTT